MSPKELKAHWDNVIAQLRDNPKLLKNKRWRMTHLYIINTKSDGKRVFKLTRAQEHFLDNLRNRNILVKSRQLGFSTLITIYILDDVLFEESLDAISVAHIKEGMIDIFDKKAKFAISNMPQAIQDQFGISQNSKTKMQRNFANGSTSNFTVALSGRSGTYQRVHISEMGKLSKLFPARAEEVISGTLPAVPSDGIIFIESTAEGATGVFYDMYMEALEAKRKGIEGLFKVQFYPHFYNWTYDDMELSKIMPEDIIPVQSMDTNDDINWDTYQQLHHLTDVEMTYYYRRWIQCKRDINILNQEYPTTVDEAFVSTGKPYFDMRKIFEYKAVAEEPQRHSTIDRKIVEEYNGPLMVYKKPEPNRTYVIGADTAEGLSNGDASTMCVIDVETRDICALYQNQIPPDEFYLACFAVGTWYNNAILAVEVNKDGLWVNNELERDGYPNLYFRQKLDDITKSMNKIFGWKTDKSSRDSMLTELRAVFNEYGIKSLPLLDEMQKFVRNTRGKPEATNGEHDDLIIAAAIAYQVRKLWFVENFRPLPTENKPTSRMDIIFGLRK